MIAICIYIYIDKWLAVYLTILTHLFNLQMVSSEAETYNFIVSVPVLWIVFVYLDNNYSLFQIIFAFVSYTFAEFKIHLKISYN